MEATRYQFLPLQPEKNGLTEPHSRDIALLNELLGQVLETIEGRELLDVAREVYGESGSIDVDTMFQRWPALQDARFTNRLLRAYTVFFQLLNLSEQKEIVRINLLRQAHEEEKPRSESLLDVFRTLKEDGVSAEELQAMLDRMDIAPTLTAHPTESRRRAILDKLEMVIELLMEFGQPVEASRLDQPINRRRYLKHEMIRILKALWLTDEFRAAQMTVEEEVQNAVYFLEHTIFDLVAWIHRDVQYTLSKTYPGHEFTVPPFVRYRSWVGGDRDGNPYVTPEITWSTLFYHQRKALQLYIRRLEMLAEEFTQSALLLQPDRELLSSIECDLQKVSLPETLKRRHENEPYCLKLLLMLERLRQMYEESKQAASQEHGKQQVFSSTSYANADELIADLELIKRSLLNGPFDSDDLAEPIDDLIVQAKTFGFYLAALDIRQHSGEHEKTLEELFEKAHLFDDGKTYSELDESEKIALLVQEMRNPRPLRSAHQKRSKQVEHVLGVFDAMKQAREIISPKALAPYIISMTHSVSDLLEVMVLAKEAGLIRWTKLDGKRVLVSEIDIVPLFETIEDLDGSSKLLDALFRNEVYRLQLEARGQFQEVMLGYSDSSKDGGYMAATWYLQDTQERLANLCAEHNVDVRFFHGRGGTVGRGGGRAHLAIRSQPPESIGGRIRFTEQGEVISFRYSFPPIAHRHLEQIVGAVLIASLEPASAVTVKDSWRAAMKQMAEHSRKTFRDLIYNDREFWPFYAQATPLTHIRKLSIASRPVSRKAKSALGIEDLRAIPWVFSWVQCRYLVPGWYGVGSALQWYAEQTENGLEMLQEMYSRWPFFAMMLHNAQIELLRSHLPTAEQYAKQVEPAELGERIHSRIQEEFDLTQSMIRQVSGVEGCVNVNQVVERTVQFRNPIVAPINQMQVALFERCSYIGQEQESAGDEWEEAMLLSIAGIAAAMQSTG